MKHDSPKKTGSNYSGWLCLAQVDLKKSRVMTALSASSFLAPDILSQTQQHNFTRGASAISFSRVSRKDLEWLRSICFLGQRPSFLSKSWQHSTAYNPRCGESTPGGNTTTSQRATNSPLSWSTFERLMLEMKCLCLEGSLHVVNQHQLDMKWAEIRWRIAIHCKLEIMCCHLDITCSFISTLFCRSTSQPWFNTNAACRCFFPSLNTS